MDGWMDGMSNEGQSEIKLTNSHKCEIIRSDHIFELNVTTIKHEF